MMKNDRTIGSICAGIGGFDVGFEDAGWKTAWQLELNDVNRAVLADRFPEAQQFGDLRKWRSYSLPRVACICAGFPCQDVSNMGSSRNASERPGLQGGRSGLFFEIMEIVGTLRPDWLVLENVPALIYANAGRDFRCWKRHLPPNRNLDCRDSRPLLIAGPANNTNNKRKGPNEKTKNEQHGR